MENIKIYNDDCLNILKTLKDETIDTIVTSPPYYNARDYSHYTSIDDYMYQMQNIFSELFRVCKNHHSIVVNVSDIICKVDNTNSVTKKYPLGAMYILMLQDIGFTYIDDYIWDKGEIQSSRQKGNPPYPYYQYPINSYEHIIVMTKHVKDTTKIPCPICNQTIIRSDSSKLSNIQGWECSNPDCPSKSKTGRGKRFSARTIMMDAYKTKENEIPKDFIKLFRRDIVHIPPEIKITSKNKNKLGHSAPYPIQIPEMAIRFFSGVNDIVLDPFLGSGTTAVVCKALN